MLVFCLTYVCTSRKEMPKVDDFMGGMFDLNEDGHTDGGEEFMAYQLYEDMNKDDSSEESIKYSNYSRND